MQQRPMTGKLFSVRKETLRKTCLHGSTFVGSQSPFNLNANERGPLFAFISLVTVRYAPPNKRNTDAPFHRISLSVHYSEQEGKCLVNSRPEVGSGCGNARYKLRGVGEEGARVADDSLPNA